jgi:hypothetical protein
MALPLPKAKHRRLPMSRLEVLRESSSTGVPSMDVAHTSASQDIPTSGHYSTREEGEQESSQTASPCSAERWVQEYDGCGTAKITSSARSTVNTRSAGSTSMLARRPGITQESTQKVSSCNFHDMVDANHPQAGVERSPTALRSQPTVPPMLLADTSEAQPSMALVGPDVPKKSSSISCTRLGSYEEKTWTRNTVDGL